MRDFGLWHGLAELSTPKLALSEEINGHALSAIACGLSQEPVIYYRCPHAGGAVFVAFPAGECVVPDGTIKLSMDANELISLARRLHRRISAKSTPFYRGRFCLETARNLAKRRARS